MYCADRAAVNTLAQALDIAERLDPQQSGALGVAVDVYHTWWDPDLYAGIARAGREKRILAYHVCDWLVPTTDLLNDRGMMGDGVIELPRIRAAVEAAGYSGPDRSRNLLRPLVGRADRHGAQYLCRALSHGGLTPISSRPARTCPACRDRDIRPDPRRSSPSGERS